MFQKPVLPEHWFPYPLTARQTKRYLQAIDCKLFEQQDIPLINYLLFFIAVDRRYIYSISTDYMRS